MLLWLGHAGEVCLFLCLGAGVCAGVWRLLAAGGGGEEMEVMGIIGAVEEERRWRVHVGERRRAGSGRVVLILVLILLLAEGMCMYVWLSLPRVSLVSPASSQPQEASYLGSWHWHWHLTSLIVP